MSDVACVQGNEGKLTFKRY